MNNESVSDVIFENLILKRRREIFAQEFYEKIIFG